jgi:glutaredoxin 3
MDSLPPHPKQAKVVVYSKDYCPYCVAAMNLLTQKGVGYEVVDVQNDQVQYEEMLKKAAPRRTVPQIFINELSVGGYDDMKKLEVEGKLEALLFPSGR